MSNSLTFEQSASILNAVASQATGTAQITPLNTAQFVSLAQTTLKTGYDNVIGAISQVLSRTIFGIRPYTRKLAGLNASAQRYGNHIRKINYVDDVPTFNRWDAYTMRFSLIKFINSKNF